MLASPSKCKTALWSTADTESSTCPFFFVSLQQTLRQPDVGMLPHPTIISPQIPQPQHQLQLQQQPPQQPSRQPKRNPPLPPQPQPPQQQQMPQQQVHQSSVPKLNRAVKGKVRYDTCVYQLFPLGTELNYVKECQVIIEWLRAYI